MQNRQIIRACKRTKYTKCTNYTTVAYNVEIMQNRLIILKLDNISYIIQNIQVDKLYRNVRTKKTKIYKIDKLYQNKLFIILNMSYITKYTN